MRYILMAVIIAGAVELSACGDEPKQSVGEPERELMAEAFAGDDGEASPVAKRHAKTIAPLCVGSWEEQSCLRAISQSTLEMAAIYAEQLDRNGHEEALETLKDQCAAATAATIGEYPAYAMTSAYTACADIIVDIADQTGLAPDPSHYQLLAGAVLCLTDDPHCRDFEGSLGADT